MRRREKPVGFTLVELLMVIAVISLRAALLLPSLRRALEESRRVACMDNLKQVYFGCIAYADDYKGWIPRPIDLR
jgi:prepilin-type N-terminal cleavage/methylation domain-containing protein